MATGYFGAQLADTVEGDAVIVFGAGPVGLYAAKSAWLMGAGRVIVVDYLENRLEEARTFAHAETFNIVEYDDIVVAMKKATGGLGADGVAHVHDGCEWPRRSIRGRVAVLDYPMTSQTRAFSAEPAIVGQPFFTKVNWHTSV